MRKKLTIIMILFTMFSVIILDCRQSMKNISQDDGVIEWHSYGEKELV